MWVLETELEKEKEPEEHLEALIRRVESLSSKIKSLSNCKPVYSFGITFNERISGFYLEHRFLKHMADIGADLDIDLFGIVQE
jgi:ABC-type Fe3+-hydroxamate transport system substrate-binding protein